MRLHHLAFRTAQLDALVGFYRDVIGLPVVKETGRSTWLRLDDAVLMIERAGDGEPAVPAGSLELVALAVDPVQRTSLTARLAARGIAVEGETEHTTYFRDPDGRRVAVSTYPLTGG